MFVADTRGGQKATAVHIGSAKPKANDIVQWCNGSTADFGSASSSSSLL